MNKILVTKGKKINVDGRDVSIRKPQYHYVDSNKDFCCAEGLIKKQDFKKKVVKTNKEKDFFCFNSTFHDDFRHIKRLAQIITPKDIGMIVCETGLNSDSIVIEGGSGSGALSCYLGKLVKKVYSYDIKKEHLEVAKENASFLKVKNVIFTLQDMTEKINEKDADAVILDMPQPWDAVKNATNALKIGGFIVGYMPTITQVMNFVQEVEKYDNLSNLKTIELIQRKWKVKGRAVRPVSEGIGHTAFLTFVRKIN